MKNDNIIGSEGGNLLTICQSGESDWRIVYPFRSETDKATAEDVQKKILALCGVEIPVRGDATLRDDQTEHEILIGETNREQTHTWLSQTPELCFSLATEENSLVILGRSPRITAFAAKYLFEKIAPKGPCDTLYLSASLRLTDTYLLSLSTGKLRTYLSGSNASYARPEGDVTVDVPSLSYSGTGGVIECGKVQIDRTSSYTGGGQYLAKLYTEGLSRAPTGEEFAQGSSVIAQGGCTAGTLLDLSKLVFLGDEFTSLGLSREACAFAVYRAILSRDPTETELAAFDGRIGDLLETLCGGSEFASLLPGIIRGPYFWRGNLDTAYTGTVWTQSELRSRLKADTVVEIPQGTLIVLTEALTVPDGCTIRTTGNPTHYTQMARFLRAPGKSGYNLVTLGYDCVLENIFIDGNFASFDRSKYGAGTNVTMTGNGNTLTGCRVSDSISHGTVLVAGATEHQVVSHNLITGYANDHDATWADGISCLGTDCLLEYNDLVDMTDGVIAVFRYINLKGSGIYIRSQNTITRYNRIVNAGNSAYAGYDNETVNWSEVGPDYDPDVVNEDPANMTGCVAYGNEFYTSAHAHIHLLCTLSTMPWRTDRGCDRAFGGTFADNSTPEGCFVNCGVGIGVDKVTDVFVRGNRLRLRLGAWCATGHVPHAYAVDIQDASGELQPGYEDVGISIYISNLIGGLRLEAADVIDLREVWVWEDPVVIPAWCFISAENRTVEQACEAMLIQEGIAELKAGQTIDGEAVLRALKEKYGF
ncbi:MAG: hypothetical protein IJT60_00670 [Clostridia bacterium]|nr:hypothetical protein [Clostridia bacterium]